MRKPAGPNPACASAAARAIDAGRWWRKTPVWLCVLDKELLMLAVARRRHAERIAIADCQASHYSHATGELVIEDGGDTAFQSLRSLTARGARCSRPSQTESLTHCQILPRTPDYPNKTMIEQILKGGPLMVPLMLCSLISLAVVFRPLAGLPRESQDRHALAAFQGARPPARKQHRRPPSPSVRPPAAPSPPSCWRACVPTRTSAARTRDRKPCASSSAR